MLNRCIDRLRAKRLAFPQVCSKNAAASHTVESTAKQEHKHTANFYQVYCLVVQALAALLLLLVWVITASKRPFSHAHSATNRAIRRARGPCINMHQPFTWTTILQCLTTIQLFTAICPDEGNTKVTNSLSWAGQSYRSGCLTTLGQASNGAKTCWDTWQRQETCLRVLMSGALSRCLHIQAQGLTVIPQVQVVREMCQSLEFNFDVVCTAIWGTLMRRLQLLQKFSSTPQSPGGHLVNLNNHSKPQHISRSLPVQLCPSGGIQHACPDHTSPCPSHGCYRCTDKKKHSLHGSSAASATPTIKRPGCEELFPTWVAAAACRRSSAA